MRGDLRLSRAASGIALAAGLAVAALGVAASCGDGGALPEDALCDPDQSIFCRCPGGDPGEKKCNAEGSAFGECEGCDDRPDVTGAGGGSSGSSGDGGGSSNPDGLPLLRACTEDIDCESSVCEFGYCTHECKLVSDCEYPISECVAHAGLKICMPACKTATDCEVYGAPPSMCGFTNAVDNWGVTVCSNWGADHELEPVDTDCAPLDHEQCNLGYDHRQRVCTPEGVCKQGCFSKNDCPNGQNCSSDGATLGGCG